MKLQPAWPHDNSDVDVRAIPAVIDSLELANISKAITLFINQWWSELLRASPSICDTKHVTVRLTFVKYAKKCPTSHPAVRHKDVWCA